MVIRYYVQRPIKYAAVQWEGTNLAEIEEFVTQTRPSVAVTDNLDGSITLSGPYTGYPRTYQTGDSLDSRGYPSTSDILDSYQEVATSGPYSYDIVE